MPSIGSAAPETALKCLQNNLDFPNSYTKIVARASSDDKKKKTPRFIQMILRVVEWVALIRFLFGMWHY